LTNIERNYISDNKRGESKNIEAYSIIDSKLQRQLEQLRQFEINKIKNSIDEIKPATNKGSNPLS
jgi:hypothetical protein